MRIMETYKTEHELVCILWGGLDGKTYEKWVDIHRDSDGKLLDVSIGNKKISDLDLEILDFLKKEGKL